MEAYSIDLRQRVLAKVDEGKMTKWDISLLFQVSPSWIRGLLKKRREGQCLLPKPRSGGTDPKMDVAADQKLRELVAQQPDATLDELSALLAQAGGPAVSRATISRSLQRQGLTLKKSR